MWIMFGIGILCLVLFFMMSSRDMDKLDAFKKSNSSLYQKYQGAFDSQPGDFSMVKMAIETIEERLLPGEEVRYSFAIARHQNKDMNVYILTNKRYIYYGIRLTKKDFKSIPYDKIENIEVKEKTLTQDLEVRSKEEKITVFFISAHKKHFDEFYVFLSERQLNPVESKVELVKE
ncbi:hypothetical protein bcgnr5372_27030 [Bacillus luti]|nr:PH domain-containing protein [Bacillus cereus]HDR8330998.1 PH domain-containing protein [Bacillus cereus]HDR8336579.1 PH domain-containing protein [Bacillus cereus]